MESSGMSPERVVIGLAALVALSLQPAATAQTRQTVEVRDQSPLNCLEELVAGGDVEDICVAEGTSTRCRDRSGPCTSTMKLTIDALRPTATLFGTSCYPLVIDDTIVFDDGRLTRLEGIGQFCLTPSSNFVEVPTACITDDSGETILSSGRFNGLVTLEAGSPPALAGWHCDGGFCGPTTIQQGPSGSYGDGVRGSTANSREPS